MSRYLLTDSYPNCQVLCVGSFQLSDQVPVKQTLGLGVIVGTVEQYVVAG